MSTRSTRRPSVSSAQIGDTGTVIAMQYLGMSGCAKLIIATRFNSKGKATRFIELLGDHRPVRHIYDELVGCEVEVVESEGSSYGMHSLRPI